jgi:hypothetical protein
LTANLLLALICDAGGMRILRTLSFALLLAVPALAEDAKTAEREPGATVEMPFLIAPVIVDGKLTAYAYVSSKVIASSRQAAVSVREKTPFLQDAFIRDVNAAPIGTADDPMKVDQPALAARMLADAKRIAGSAKVVSFVITQIQVAPVRPNQT